MIAYVWANGVVEFTNSGLPPHALPNPQWDDEDFKRTVLGLCRLSYDGQSRLIPGIPEAQNEEEKLEALGRFDDTLKVIRSRRRQSSPPC